MLTRRHIRVKVMQTLYAFKRDEGDSFNDDIKFLHASIHGMFNLYLLLISILPALQKKGIDYIEKSKQKHLATDADKNPNRKFVNNEVLQLISQNTQLAEIISKNKEINWDLDSEYIDILFKEILKSELYSDYMQTRTSNFTADKQFIIDMFQEIIAPNEKLYSYLEDKNLTWLDDLPSINTAILKLLRKVKPTSPAGHFLPTLLKDEDDIKFAEDLLKKAILNKSKLLKTIEERTKNWDSDRIADIDYILLQMGVCEVIYFPSIPVKVTINEYLEIAKEYSTPKSSIFINGILDRLVKDYQETGDLNKIGRGLM